MKIRFACLSALLLLGMPRSARSEAWGDPVRVFFEALPAVQVQAPALGILNNAYAKAALSPVPAVGLLDAIVALKARADERVTEDGLANLVMGLHFAAAAPLDPGLRKKLSAATASAAQKLGEMRRTRVLAFEDRAIAELTENRPLGPDGTGP
jgi:hypothetical protein